MFSEDKPKFKRGDFLISKSSKQIAIYKSAEDKYNITFSSYYNNNDGISNNNWVVVSFRLCNDREKQEMLDYMHSKGKDWDEVNMEVIPYVWKPKDKELVWAWDDYDYCSRVLAFYDIKNNCCFCLDGMRNGANYEHYESFEGEYPKWAKEALNKLEE